MYDSEQMIADYEVIKTLLGIKEVALWNENGTHAIYEIKVPSLSQTNIKQLRKMRLVIFSLSADPQKQLVHVRIARKLTA